MKKAESENTFLEGSSELRDKEQTMSNFVGFKKEVSINFWVDQKMY